MAKQLIFKEAARLRMLEGISKLAEAVKVTLGPAGHLVLLEKFFGSPVITKDGVTVARDIVLEDPFENMGAKLVQEIADKTNTIAGDGTTTAVVLAEAMFTEGLKAIAAGVKPAGLIHGMKTATDTAAKALKEASQEVNGKEDIKRVATVSSNNDRVIGSLLADAFEKVGKDGVITTEEGKGMETSLELVEGMQFPHGFMSPHFINRPEHADCSLESPRILVTPLKITDIRKLMHVLEACSSTTAPLFIIAEHVENEALATLVLNKMRGTLSVCAVKAPGYGESKMEMLEDIAALVGTTVISPELGHKLEDVTIEQLGMARRIAVDKESTTIIEGGGTEKAIKARIEILRTQIKAANKGYNKEKLEERLAKLSGGVAQISIGGSTETEIKEKMARVEDALQATRAAIEEGCVVGGGVAYINARRAVMSIKSDSLDMDFGVGIVSDALKLPLHIIAANAGASGEIVVKTVKESKEVSYGYDALRNEFCDLMERGIIDPTKVARTALYNATSVVSLMLITEAMVVDKPGENKNQGPAPGMGMTPPGLM